MNKVKKSEFDAELTLTDIKFVLKGFRQVLSIKTTIAECCDFVDFLNDNPAFKAFDKATKDKFNNKFYTFTDYEKKETITINLQEVKSFSIPFFIDAGEDEVEFKVLVVG